MATNNITKKPATGWARRVLPLCLITLLPLTASAQFGNARGGFGGSNQDAFNQNRANNFNDYRQKLNAEYVKLTREQWRGFITQPAVKVPDRDVKPVAPIKMSDDDAKRRQEQKQEKQITIQKVVTPIKKNTTPPQPVAPVKETPVDNVQQLSFAYLGQTLHVRKPSGQPVRLSGLSENAVADAWEKLCDTRFNNLVVDCVKLRSSQQLCDWAYLLMLKSLADSYCGSGNDATLLMAFLYSQSGYKIRLGQADGRLEMLYATQHILYNRAYVNCDGDRFYPFNKEVKNIKVNAAKYPKEQSMSLWVPSTPQAAFQAAPARTLTAKRYPAMSAKVSENKNLLTFFNTYPTSEVGGNFMTRWAMYANTPICANVRNELYPQLKRAIQGDTPLQAVEKLLNWVQTAFVYEYDDKVWGGDRAFFPDETLYYPYCDCEDRSILFTRLVRDLVGLKCILVYYPGHLASAVSFNTQVNGDYISIGGKKYTVCDPTYIGAPVGSTMPKMDNASANVIMLE